MVRSTGPACPPYAVSGDTAPPGRHRTLLGNAARPTCPWGGGPASMAGAGRKHHNPGHATCPWSEKGAALLVTRRRGIYPVHTATTLTRISNLIVTHRPPPPPPLPSASARPWANDDDPVPAAPAPMTSRAAVEPSAVPWGTYSRVELSKAIDSSLSRPATTASSSGSSSAAATTRILALSAAAPAASPAFVAPVPPPSMTPASAPVAAPTTHGGKGAAAGCWSADGVAATKRTCVAQMLEASATEAEIMAALASVDAQYVSQPFVPAFPAVAVEPMASVGQHGEDPFFASREEAKATARRARGSGVAGIFSP